MNDPKIFFQSCNSRSSSLLRSLAGEIIVQNAPDWIKRAPAAAAAKAADKAEAPIC